MAASLDWKELKRKIARRNGVKHLRALDPKSLKQMRNRHGKSLLHVAAKKGCFEVCKHLIEIGCDVNLKDNKNGYTPLICALLRKKKVQKTVKLLLKLGSDMWWTDKSIGSQAHLLFSGERNIARMLCTALKKREKNWMSAAACLLQKGWSFDNVTYLQDYQLTRTALQVCPSLKDNYEKLEDAVTRQDVEQVKLLLELVSHSKRIMSWVILEKAATLTSPESLKIIKLILNKGAPIDGFPGDTSTPISRAVYANNPDNTWIFLNHGAKNDNYLFFTNIIRNSTKEGEEDDQECVRDCIRLLIEHQGIKKNAPFLLRISKTHSDLCRQTIEYLSIAHYEERDDFFSAGMFHLYFNEEFDDYYYDECIKELNKVKNYKIDEFTSMWDLLFKTIDEMVPLTRNDCLVDKINAESFTNTFPRYAKNLQFKVKMALKKKLLIDHSIDVLSKCVPRIGLCLPALEKIVFYLDDPFLLGLFWDDFNFY